MNKVAASRQPVHRPREPLASDGIRPVVGGKNLRESHAHDVTITKEAPNYSVE